MKNKKRFIKKRELLSIFIIIVFFLLFFSGYSMGKIYQYTNIKTKAEIAEPILVVENNPVIEIDGENEKQYYNFKVKNNKGNGKINEINLEYNIEILSKSQESIIFKIYKDDIEIPLKDNKTENIIMKSEEMQEDNYKLEIIYDKSKDHSIEDIIQDVKVKIHSEQMKL